MIKRISILLCALYWSALITSGHSSKEEPLPFNIEQAGNQATIYKSFSTKKKPEVLIVLYIAARNDLFPFAARSIKQLQSIGASEHVKIFIRFDLQRPEQPLVTKHFFIENNKVMQIGTDLSMDSGDEQSLIYTVQCAYERFPADELVLILWNHGSGGIEPNVQKIANPSDLFEYNTKKGLLELNRSINFFDYISQGETTYDETKGICFDDSSGNYLTIEKLTRALHVIATEVIKKKIKILACDACLMAGADVFIGLEPYVDYFIGSQEVEWGSGHRYDILLDPLLKGELKCDAAFARHFVWAYKEAYSKITQDYTQSAIDLKNINQLEYSIDQMAGLLIKALDSQKGKTVREAIRLSRHKHQCTRFGGSVGECSYIDFGHFCSNLLKNVSKCELNDPVDTAIFKEELMQLLTSIKKVLSSVVIANAVGKNLQQATGVSLYFPEFIMHKSYNHNAFAQKTNWLPFLKKYLATR